MTDNRLPLERWPEKTRKLPYGKIGYGYKIDPEDPFHIIPDIDQIAILEQAFDYIDAGSSWREVGEWVSQKLLCSIVHQTISNLYKIHRRPFLNRKTKRRTSKPHSKETRELVGAKVSARLAAKRVKELEAKNKQLKAEDFPEPPVPTEERRGNPVLKDPSLFSKEKPKPPVPTEVSFVFKPNPGPQTDFLAASEEEVLYGGSAGGGKSFAMLADPMRYFSEPNFVGLLLRRTNDELRELKWESQKMYPKAFPGAKWKEKDSMWVFPSGAKFWITYLDRDDDVMRYQGQAFTWIGMDELTQYPTSFAYTYLKSRLRVTDPSLKKALGGATGYMRATTNPGGPGHHWVKKMFIDPEVPNKSFWATDIETGEVLKYPTDHEDPSKAGKPLFKRRFIPAKLRDNPYLHADGAYERSLHGLPEDQRRKLLEGDWSIVEGAAFADFNPKYHVCKPFDIPPTWRRFRSADYGFSSPACVLWFAIDPSFDTLYVYRELYGSGMTGRDLAHKVLSLESDESISYGMLDSSVWHDRGHYGPSIAEEMIAEGCRWRPSDRSKGSRTAGKNRLHELMKITETALGEKLTGIKFFDNCRQIIADLPAIPSHPDGIEDIDDRYPSDHSYDALRYGIMSRPRASSPLDWGTKPHGKYIPSDSVFGY
jgi:hypothetical protein